MFADTYFILDKDPDTNITDSDIKQMMRDLGASENLNFVENGNHYAVQLHDVVPPFLVVSRSKTPVNP